MLIFNSKNITRNFCLRKTFADTEEGKDYDSGSFQFWN